MERRDFLSFARTAGMAATVPNLWRVPFQNSWRANPFTLGVASGDPTPDRVMLWTRLAPEPLTPDGGMWGRRVGVQWEVAADDAFGSIVRSGRATAVPELGHSIHVDVDGLDPDRWYFYRFMSGDAVSAIGRTRTAPLENAVSTLRLGVASCQHFESGYFTPYRHMADESLDLVTHLGDYIYEYSGVDERIRRHATAEIESLSDSRIRYAQYKGDPLLQGAHAACPWLVTWDDHEFDNNYAGSIGENGMESAEQMQWRRAGAYQAWWENQPVRLPRVQSWADLNITRRVRWGTMADLWVCDTRQYRSDQACNDGNKAVPCGDWNDPQRTVLGSRQERWLTDGLTGSDARWQVLAQQIMMAPYDFRGGDEAVVSMDQWSGYPMARDRLLGSIGERSRNSTVVLSGDIHSNWVNELRSDFSRDDTPTVAAEFVTTSISSGGDGADRSSSVNDTTMPENPHMKWQNARRGYISCTVESDEWRADYRTVPYVTRPGAPIKTASSWRVERGVPGIEEM